MRRIWIVAVTVLLAGCATAAQRQYRAMSTGVQSASAQMRACTTALYNSPEVAALRSHWPYDAQQASLQQLSDTATVTGAEAQAIEAAHPGLKACQQQELEKLASAEPGLVPILVRMYSGIDDDLVLLLQKKLAWGEFTKRRRDRAAQALAAAEEETQRVVSDLRQEHQAELATRQRAADALAQWAQTQQLINAATRPISTTCFGAGNTLNCTTR